MYGEMIPCSTTPEVNNYEIVFFIQQDIYDLEDCIEIFSSIVDELKVPSLKRSEINTVI
jgi:hypothetical protein